MTTVIVALFVLGYLAIALEHPLKIDKSAVALGLGVLLWTIYALFHSTMLPESDVPNWFKLEQGVAIHAPAEPGVEADTDASGASDDASVEDDDVESAVDNEPELHGKNEPAEIAGAEGHGDLSIHYLVDGQLLHHLAEIASILFFLMGAMTIVELVDAFEGFSIITSRISTRNKVKLLWVISWLTFFMSAVLDNLTTTIVMVSLLKKLIKDRDTRLLFVGVLVIAANAGGAWTVIGDVTTTMLWIKGKITPVHTMIWVFLPSVVALLVPLIAVSFFLKGDIQTPDVLGSAMRKHVRPFHQMLFFTIGFAGLLAVPIFKTVTHLPPFMGMMLSLSVIWIASELVKKDLHETVRSSTHVVEVLKRIDTASILFFLGILLAIGCLASTGILDTVAQSLDAAVPSLEVVAVVIGLVSAIVDNVPLVAAGIEMYEFPVDDPFWTFLAYCAGTGGSCLIIGSAAGVAAMGLEKIDFLWYLRKIGPLALLGYFAGVVAYLIQEAVTGEQSGIVELFALDKLFDLFG